jgi:hypothetical protein
MRTVSSFACTALLSCVGLFGFTMVGHAHPEHAGKGQPHEHADEPGEITDAQKEKRLERVIRQAERRLRNREQRSKDRRGHLKKRLGRHLKGGDLTPDLVAELKLHAERTALLRQIRYIGAQEKDYEAVVSADKVLARQNSNHEAWWRTVLRAARKK